MTRRGCNDVTDCKTVLTHSIFDKAALNYQIRREFGINKRSVDKSHHRPRKNELYSIFLYFHKLSTPHINETEKIIPRDAMTIVYQKLVT